MPPSRRRPNQTPPPTRRPRVAGLRHGESTHPRPQDERPEQDAEQQSRRDRGADRPEPGSGEDTEVMPAIGADEPAPRPSRKSRPTSTSRPGAGPRPKTEGAKSSGPGRKAGAAAEPVPAEADEERSTWRDWPKLPMVLGVIAVLLGGFAVFAGVQWQNLTGGTVVENTALTDNAGTAEVGGQITTAINTVFSYNYTNVDKTKQAAQNLLTGQALCQYNALFKTVQQQAPQQKLVLTVTVTNSGVEMLQGDRARVLLFVDQRSTRTANNQTDDAQAVFAVDAVNQGGKWKIDNIDTFNGQNPQNCKG